MGDNSRLVDVIFLASVISLVCAAQIQQIHSSVHSLGGGKHNLTGPEDDRGTKNTTSHLGEENIRLTRINGSHGVFANHTIAHANNTMEPEQNPPTTQSREMLKQDVNRTLVRTDHTDGIVSNHKLTPGNNSSEIATNRRYAEINTPLYPANASSGIDGKLPTHTQSKAIRTQEQITPSNKTQVVSTSGKVLEEKVTNDQKLNSPRNETPATGKQHPETSAYSVDLTRHEKGTRHQEHDVRMQDRVSRRQEEDISNTLTNLERRIAAWLLQQTDEDHILEDPEQGRSNDLNSSPVTDTIPGSPAKEFHKDPLVKDNLSPAAPISKTNTNEQTHTTHNTETIMGRYKTLHVTINPNKETLDSSSNMTKEGTSKESNLDDEDMVEEYDDVGSHHQTSSRGKIPHDEHLEKDSTTSPLNNTRNASTTITGNTDHDRAVVHPKELAHGKESFHTVGSLRAIPVLSKQNIQILPADSSKISLTKLTALNEKVKVSAFQARISLSSGSAQEKTRNHLPQNDQTSKVSQSEPQKRSLVAMDGTRPGSLGILKQDVKTNTLRNSSDSTIAFSTKNATVQIQKSVAEPGSVLILAAFRNTQKSMPRTELDAKNNGSHIHSQQNDTKPPAAIQQNAAPEVNGISELFPTPSVNDSRNNAQARGKSESIDNENIQSNRSTNPSTIKKNEAHLKLSSHNNAELNKTIKISHNSTQFFSNNSDEQQLNNKTTLLQSKQGPNLVQKSGQSNSSISAGQERIGQTKDKPVENLKNSFTRKPDSNSNEGQPEIQKATKERKLLEAGDIDQKVFNLSILSETYPKTNEASVKIYTSVKGNETRIGNTTSGPKNTSHIEKTPLPPVAKNMQQARGLINNKPLTNSTGNINAETKNETASPIVLPVSRPQKMVSQEQNGKLNLSSGTAHSERAKPTTNNAVELPFPNRAEEKMVHIPNKTTDSSMNHSVEASRNTNTTNIFSNANVSSPMFLEATKPGTTKETYNQNSKDSVTKLPTSSPKAAIAPQTTDVKHLGKLDVNVASSASSINRPASLDVTKEPQDSQGRLKHNLTAHSSHTESVSSIHQTSTPPKISQVGLQSQTAKISSNMAQATSLTEDEHSRQSVLKNGSDTSKQNSPNNFTGSTHKISPAQSNVLDSNQNHSDSLTQTKIHLNPQKGLKSPTVTSGTNYKLNVSSSTKIIERKTQEDVLHIKDKNKKEAILSGTEPQQVNKSTHVATSQNIGLTGKTQEILDNVRGNTKIEKTNASSSSTTNKEVTSKADEKASNRTLMKGEQADFKMDALSTNAKLSQNSTKDVNISKEVMMSKDSSVSVKVGSKPQNPDTRDNKSQTQPLIGKGNGSKNSEKDKVEVSRAEKTHQHKIEATVQLEPSEPYMNKIKPDMNRTESKSHTDKSAVNSDMNQILNKTDINTTIIKPSMSTNLAPSEIKHGLNQSAGDTTSGKEDSNKTLKYTDAKVDTFDGNMTSRRSEISKSDRPDTVTTQGEEHDSNNTFGVPNANRILTQPVASKLQSHSDGQITPRTPEMTKALDKSNVRNTQNETRAKNILGVQDKSKTHDVKDTNTSSDTLGTNITSHKLVANSTLATPKQAEANRQPVMLANERSRKSLQETSQLLHLLGEPDLGKNAASLDFGKHEKRSPENSAYRSNVFLNSTKDAENRSKTGDIHININGASNFSNQAVDTSNKGSLDIDGDQSHDESDSVNAKGEHNFVNGRFVQQESKDNATEADITETLLTKRMDNGSFSLDGQDSDDDASDTSSTTSSSPTSTSEPDHDDVSGDSLNATEAEDEGELFDGFSAPASLEKVPAMTPYRAQDFSLLKPSPDKEATKKDDKNKNKNKSLSGNQSDMPSAPEEALDRSNHSLSCFDSCGQPRAQAAVSAVLTSHFGPTKDQIIPFDLELIDLADNYDNSTGIFICTIPGTYVISLYLMSHPGAKVNARVLINNRPIAALWADDAKSAGFYPSSSTQTVAQLAFGDQVYVMLVDGGYGDSWVHANYNAFNIFLLYEEIF